MNMTCTHMFPFSCLDRQLVKKPVQLRLGYGAHLKAFSSALGFPNLPQGRVLSQSTAPKAVVASLVAYITTTWERLEQRLVQQGMKSKLPCF
jgi:hypothetical protein